MSGLLDGLLVEAAEYVAETREAFIARIEAEGLRIEYPADNELQIDLDNADHAAAFARMFPMAERDFDAHVTRRSPSRSGLPREHVVVRLPGAKLDPMTRIALQAALGSDPMREFLSVRRVMRGELPATLFVERP